MSQRIALLVAIVAAAYAMFLLEQIPATAAPQSTAESLSSTHGIPPSDSISSDRAGTPQPTPTTTVTMTAQITATRSASPTTSPLPSLTSTSEPTAVVTTPVTTVGSPSPVPTVLTTQTSPPSFASPTPFPTVAPADLTEIPPLPTATIPLPIGQLPGSPATPPGEEPPSTRELWATEQECTTGLLTDASNSIDLEFNDRVASSGPLREGDSWTYTALQDTTLSAGVQAMLDVRICVEHSLNNDSISLEMHNDFGWQVVATFRDTNAPPEHLTTLRYDVSEIVDSPEEINAAQVRFTIHQQDGGDPITIMVDEVRIYLVDSLPVSIPSLPTPTAELPAPTYVPGEDDPHVQYTSTTSSCAACHRTHTAAGMAVRISWPEETLCFACHTTEGSGTDVQTIFASYANTNTRFFTHQVAAVSGIHRLGQTSSSDFGGANRHIECEDCHEPHEATRGPAYAPMIQREMNRASGVDPLWTGSGAPSAYTWLSQAEREYQVCFKCHSSFTTLPSYLPDGWNGSTYVPDGLSKLTSLNPAQIPDSRDLAQEFNPFQASFHPVVAMGRNQSIPVESFVNGWDQTSMVYCTDCHTNANAEWEGSGPHGSPRLHLLDGQADYSTVYRSGSKVGSQEVCFKCHDYATYVTGTSDSTNFAGHEDHMNNRRGTTCYTCHDTHGSEQLHLINFDASEMDFLDERNSQTAWFVDSTGQAGCYVICHGRKHDPLTYTP